MQQDIVPQKRKSIRDIPIPEGRSFPSRPPQRFTHHTHDTHNTPRENLEIKENTRMSEHQNSDFAESVRKDRRSGSGKKKMIFSIVAVIVLISVFAFFSRSYANVYVQSKELSMNSSVTTSIPFSVEESTAEKNVSIKATGEEKVSEKSKGKITIFNEYEEQDQRLLKDTRFESPEGLIYRIPSSVVVPGLTRDEKGNIVPGKLEVEVVADQVGEKYNIGASKFTVPGFKDLPQYESFYATSNSSMVGGFDGIRKVISESDRQNAEKELKTQLKEQLIADAKSKETDNNLIVADDSMIVYEIQGDKVNGDQVVVSAKGVIKAISFDANEFGNRVAAAAISNFTSNENVRITNINELKVILNQNPDENSNIDVDISGNIKFKWQNNSDALKKSLAGTEKEDIDKIVEQFPGVTKVRTELRPVWSGTFPEDESKINIIDEEN